jgi:PAS domain S-box-containing protein
VDWLSHQLIAQHARINEERLFIEKLLLNLEGGLAYLDGELVYQIVNPSFAGLFGRKPKDFLGRKAFEVLPDADNQLRRIFESVIKTGAPFKATNFPLSYTDKGKKQETYWDGSVTPILGEDGKISGILILCFNVSDRVQLQRERNNLAAIVEGSFDGIIGVDLGGIIRSWNESAERIYGYTAEEAIGKPVNITIPPDSGDDVPFALKKIERGERVTFYMTQRVTKSRRKLMVCLAISPIHDLDDDVIGASMITRDLTEKLEGAPSDVGTASILVSQWLAPPSKRRGE